MATMEFIIGISFRLHYRPQVDLASDRNEYQEYSLLVSTADNLTT